MWLLRKMLKSNPTKDAKIQYFTWNPKKLGALLMMHRTHKNHLCLLNTISAGKVTCQHALHRQKKFNSSVVHNGVLDTCVAGMRQKAGSPQSQI